MKFPKRFLLLAVLSAAFLAPRLADAYGKDVHFNLTYVLCRMAGMPAKDAIWVAESDQSMDDNEHTTAIYGKSDAEIAKWWVSHRDLSRRNGLRFHVFSDAEVEEGTDIPRLSCSRYKDGGEAARSAISDRLREMWAIIPKQDSDEDSHIAASIALGQFLHLRQDWFSHRQFSEAQEDDEKFLPYGPSAGHSPDGDGHCADYVGLRPTLAKRMAYDTFEQIRSFLSINKVPMAPYRPDQLDALIDALVPLYAVEGDRPENEWTPIKNMSAPGDQSVINAALKAKLSQSWIGDLPIYSYALPFDKPETPLDVVKAEVAKRTPQSFERR